MLGQASKSTQAPKAKPAAQEGAVAGVLQTVASELQQALAAAQVRQLASIPRLWGCHRGPAWQAKQQLCGFSEVSVCPVRLCRLAVLALPQLSACIGCKDSGRLLQASSDCARMRA